jgi:hypothetical protein
VALTRTTEEHLSQATAALISLQQLAFWARRYPKTSLVGLGVAVAWLIWHERNSHRSNEERSPRRARR